MSMGAIILAAGKSTRMGAFKPLLQLGGRAMIEHGLGHFLGFGCSPVIVVTGRERERLEDFLSSRYPGKLLFAHNPAYDKKDMFASVKIGLQQLPETCGAVFLSPADVPCFEAGLLEKMAAVPAPVVRPSFRGRAGHPLLMGREVWERVLAYQGRRGLRGAIAGESQAFVEAGSRGILLDGDTPEDFEEIKDFVGRHMQWKCKEKACRNEGEEGGSLH